ncbi:hypothetical protein [Paenarthrobacter sp. Y-19]|uniref:hypothetical protein n=1 Tax=Paenarthrobacter sp. Y-19 TaxID=3031125 RepID=UPI0023DC14A1|nr:hypothetical protein [Paenarthrobacter sp. Y-19]
MLELPLFGEEVAATGLWRVVVPAPVVKPVRKRKTGKVVQRKPWLNSNDRDHWRVIRPITANWRANAAEAAARAGLPTGLARVRITAHVVKARAGDYDAGNYYPTAKAVVDGSSITACAWMTTTATSKAHSCTRAVKVNPPSSSRLKRSSRAHGHAS